MSDAQEPRFEEFHTWTDLTTIYNFSDRFRYDGEIGTRSLLTDDYWTAFVLQPSMRYRYRPWLSLHLGGAFIYNRFQDEEDLPELRPWAQAQLTWPRPKGFAVTHRFRLEYRALQIRPESKWRTSARFRYRLQGRSPQFPIGSAADFHALAFIEVFGNLESEIDGSFGDRYRVGAGFGKHVTKATQIQLNYFFHKVRLSPAKGGLEFDDHVVRLRFSHSFN